MDKKNKNSERKTKTRPFTESSLKQVFAIEIQEQQSGGRKKILFLQAVANTTEIRSPEFLKNRSLRSFRMIPRCP